MFSYIDGDNDAAAHRTYQHNVIPAGTGCSIVGGLSSYVCGAYRRMARWLTSGAGQCGASFSGAANGVLLLGKLAGQRFAGQRRMNVPRGGGLEYIQGSNIAYPVDYEL